MQSAVKVEIINDFTHKSFSDYTGPSEQFDRSNIFFAPNGNGKTSLANGIKDEYVKNHDVENLRIYDKDFIETHLLLKEDRNIRGVKADFGKKDVNLEKKIKALEDELKVDAFDLTKLQEDNRKLVATTETAIDDIFKRRKGKASIAKKSYKDGVHEKVVQLWVDDYQAAMKKFPDEKYDEIDGERNFGDNLSIINGLKLDNPPSISEEEVATAGTIASKNYAKVDIPSSEIVSWLETGLHIHQDKTVCEFCGNSINIDDISSRIGAFIKDEQTVDRKKLETLRDALQLVYRSVKIVVDDRDAILSCLENSEAGIKAFDSLQGALDPLINTGKAIVKKIDDMTLVIELESEQLLRQLNAINADIASLNAVKDELKRHYEEKINRLEILVKGAIGFEITNSDLIAGNISSYNENKKQIAGLATGIDDKRAAIRKLRDSKSDLDDFADYLNTIFEEIGIDFRLQLSGKSYTLQHNVLGVKLTIDDISEGECNLLALVYFYYEMLSSDLKSIKDNIEVVIIDDPVTSMDDENRFYILELVKSVIDNKSLQSFVLTHSWHDYCDLNYGKSEQQGVKRFEITKTNGQSDIILSRSIMSPYKRLYKEVYDFSQKNISDVTAEEALHIPNTMRRVLEEYIRFNFSIDLATQTHFNEIAQALFEEEVANISEKNGARLKMLLSVCNILSHGAPRTRSINEIHASARFLINRMLVINKYHHDKMKQP